MERINKLVMPIVVKSTFWLTICMFLQKVFAIISTPIFTRLMTTEEYGEYSVFVSVESILLLISTLNINAIVATKGYNKFKNKEEAFNGNAQFISSICLLVCFLIYYIFRDAVNALLGLTTGIMILMFAEMLVKPAFELWSARQRYDYKYKEIVIFTIIFVVSNTFFGLFAVINANNRGNARIFASCLVAIILYGIIYLYNFFSKKWYIDKEMLSFIIRFNLPLIPHGLSNQILARSDVFMIQYFQGKSQVGIYNLGYNIASILLMFTTSLNNVYVPWLYKKLDKKEYDDIAKYSTYILVVIAFIAIIFISMAPELLYLFAPETYQAAAHIIGPVAIGISFTLMYGMFANIELYLERTTMVMLGSVLVAVLNIVLNAVCIPRWGFIAAAYTTLISYILYTLIHFCMVRFFCKDQIDVFRVYNIKYMISTGTIQIFFLFFMTRLFDYMLLRYIFMLLAVFIFAIIFFKLGKGEDYVKH